MGQSKKSFYQIIPSLRSHIVENCSNRERTITNLSTMVSYRQTIHISSPYEQHFLVTQRSQTTALPELFQVPHHKFETHTQ